MPLFPQKLRFTAPHCLILILAAQLLLAGCAYQLAADMPSVIGDGSKTLKVKGVDYPTLDAWLPYALRSALRDEINSRHMAEWVDSGPADYEIQLKVISFLTQESIRSKEDYTLLYSTTLTLEAIVYEGGSNREVWRSGSISYSDQMEAPESRLVSGDVIAQVMRNLADKMRSTF